MTDYNNKLEARSSKLEAALTAFAESIQAKFSTSITGEPEEQLRTPFEGLIKDAGEILNLSVTAIGETLLENRLGRPDYAVTTANIPCGYVELKASGKGANPNSFKGHDRQQWERFKNLPNLLYTDGIEWSLYRTGELIKKIKFTGNPCVLGRRAIGGGDAESLLIVLTDFLTWEPVVPNTAKQLAHYLAPLCRMLKKDVLDALERKSPVMLSTARDWRNYLFPDADDEKFADSYAQTVTFALLLARSNGANTLFLDQAVSSLTSKNTLLGRALYVLTDEQVEEDVKASLGMLKRVISAVPHKTMSTGKHDPWLHFYEDFLQEYDPKLRKDAGAYYTPLDVVHAQVSLVDDILQSRMNKPMGFAEGGVTTLDPAVGTGTYLLSIVDQAMKRVALVEGAGAVKGRASLLASSLYGFEIMVGPYAVAALRMTRLLQDFGGGVPGDGVQVFLSNTLESPHELMPELPMMYQAIGLEHRRAKRVKESVPVLVCIGNPPYDRHEAANESNKMSTGAWVRWGESKAGKDAILNDFIEPVKAAGKGVQLKNIYNLYVYFWRWALWKVFEQPFASTGGIVSFITASSFMDGDAFIGMRKKMRELCDEIWFIDLGGDGRGTQQEENVFAIKTPVVITIAVRYDQPQPSVPAKAYYAKLDGTRSEKLEALKNVTDLNSIPFKCCPGSWVDSFLPQPEATDYLSWPKLTDLMPWQHSGAQFTRNWPIAPTKNILERRWQALISTADRKALFRESRDRAVGSQLYDLFDQNRKLDSIAALTQDSTQPSIYRYGFRSFDRQYAIVDSRVGDYLRPVLWLSKSVNQIYFLSSFSQVLTSGPSLTIASNPPDYHCFNGRGSKDVLPLYRDDEGKEANLHPELLKKLSESLGYQVAAIDWACYLYCVAGHPGYIELFKQDISRRDIRIPITTSHELFSEAIALGKVLIHLHSYGEQFSADLPPVSGVAKCIKAVQCDSPVDSFHFDLERKVLCVGNGEFGPITSEIWEFNVSGLKVVQSWLGYRMANRSGKKTSGLDEIGLDRWESELTSELLQLLWTLERTLSEYPKQAELLKKITQGELLKAIDFSPVPDAAVKPPKFNSEQAEMKL